VGLKLEATDTLAPAFAIDIQDREIPGGITQLIERVEYESVDGMADIARVHAINPDFKVSKAKVFTVGNEMNIWMGYGSGTLKLVGRVVITKVRPTFPESGMPTIEVIGYTPDAHMADKKPTVKKPPPAPPAKAPRGRAFNGLTYSDAVQFIATSDDYNFEVDVDDSHDPPSHFIQKVGLSDYDFVKGLANLSGFMFWIGWNPKTSKWRLYFKDPNLFQMQEKEYKFKYDMGDETTLLSFSPELNIKGFQTKITAQAKDPKTGQTISVEVAEENTETPDTDATSDPTEDVKGEYTSPGAVKLYLQDYCFEVVANKFFKKGDEAALREWAKQWFERMKENFVLSHGKTIGIEDLEARQVHTIEGVYGGYDGKYYFSKVKHIMDKDGYFCEFAARKVVSK
jgi:phage protein D